MCLSFSSFVISRGTTLLLSKQYTLIDISVLFANLETSVNFTGNSIPFNASSNSCSHFFYFETLYECIFTGCSADRTAHKKHLLSLFCTLIIGFLLAIIQGRGT